MLQRTVRDHDQIDALRQYSGPAQVRLEPGKAAEGWADFLTEASIDKDTLSSRVYHQDIVGGLGHRWHEACLRYPGKFGFRDVDGEDRPDRIRPIAIRDHGRLEVADLESIEAVPI